MPIKIVILAAFVLFYLGSILGIAMLHVWLENRTEE